MTDVVAFDFDQIESLLDLDMQDGSFATQVANPVVVSVDEAAAIDASVGDVLTTEFANGAVIDTTVVGLFDDQAVMTQDYLYDHSVLAGAALPRAPSGSPWRSPTVHHRQRSKPWSPP